MRTGMILASGAVTGLNFTEMAFFLYRGDLVMALLYGLTGVCWVISTYMWSKATT